MKTPTLIQTKHHRLARLIAVATTTIVLAACATQTLKPNGAEVVRNKLIALQGNSYLANRAPVEIRDADAAITAAEQSQKDPVLTRHLVLIADQKVDIATAWAQSRFYEDQRKELSAQSEAARLESRTLEADRARRDANQARNQTQIAVNDANAARNDASTARNDSAIAQNQAAVARNDSAIAQNQAAVARNDADAALTAAVVAQDQTAVARDDASAARNQTELARRDTNAARKDTDAARMEAADLQRQIVELNGRNTDRGLVVTLGDVLFETGKSELRGGTPDNLDKLATFLKHYENRTAMIEGHTDNVGTDSSNFSLSQRRAASVQSYLVSHGVNSTHISASGQGETKPIASNETDTGRQQNRRVEVIISNPVL